MVFIFRASHFSVRKTHYDHCSASISASEVQASIQGSQIHQLKLVASKSTTIEAVAIDRAGHGR